VRLVIVLQLLAAGAIGLALGQLLRMLFPR
jgi:hypothetical protein